MVFMHIGWLIVSFYCEASDRIKQIYATHIWSQRSLEFMIKVDGFEGGVKDRFSQRP